MRISDWSSDVCSSDLLFHRPAGAGDRELPEGRPAGAGRRDLPQPGAHPVGRRPAGGSQAGCAEGLGQGCEEARGSQEDSCPEGLRTQSIAAEVVGIDRIDWYKLGSSRRSEEHTSELQSLMRISYAVFCLKKKNKTSSTNYRDEE